MTYRLKFLFIIFILNMPCSYSQRLASTSPAITQTLVDLGLKDKIIGASTYCILEEKVPRIGTAFSINWEKLLYLKPTYLLTQKIENSVTVSKAEKLKIKVIEYDFRNIKTLRESIASLGKEFVTDKKRVKSVLSDLDSKIALIKKRKLGIKVLGIVGLNEKIGQIVSVSAVGKNNYYDDLLNLSGIKNVINREGYATLSIEKVLKLDFDYIFIFSPSITKGLVKKVEKMTGKNVISWNNYESQEVGTLFIKFMGSYYEKLSSQI